MIVLVITLSLASEMSSMRRLSLMGHIGLKALYAKLHHTAETQFGAAQVLTRHAQLRYHRFCRFADTPNYLQFG